MYTIAFTGHRPPKIGGYSIDAPLRQAVIQKITQVVQYYASHYTNCQAIVGGALGVDQDAASICYSLGIPYLAAIPCLGQDSKWPKESRDKYKIMLEKAYERVLVHNGTYNFTCMDERNKYMVDNCDLLIAVWDGSDGGTANCVRYAQHEGREITLIDPSKLLL